MEEFENIETRRVSFKKIFFFIFSIVLIITGVILYSRYVATTGLYVKEYKVVNTKLPTSFYGLKIVHISDVHYGRTIQAKELDQLVDKVNVLKPDIVVLTGDLLDKDVKLTDQDIKTIIKSLRQIQASLGKYAVTGNHDVSFDSWTTIIKNSNFININDSYELIYQDDLEPIMMAGLSSNLESSKRAKDKHQPIQDYITSLNKEDPSIPKFKILLLHEPDYVTSISSSEYDLVLAGHSHNGQVRLPGIGAIIKPKGATTYFDEYYSLGKTDLYISSGVGTSSYNFRLFNRPSINLYRVVNK